jgi:DNA repair protein RadA/Sms
MAKKAWRCSECGDISPVMKPQCANGHSASWVEALIETSAPSGGTGKLANARSAAALAVEAGTAGQLQRLGDVSEAARARVKTGIEEFDRVVGGGLIKGSSALIAGEPGSGKSTLLASVVDALVAQGHSAIYISGEESVGQIKERAHRLGLHLDAIRVLAEEDANVAAEVIERERPEFCVIDSIQTFFPSPDAPSGTTASVLRVTHILQRTAKKVGTTLLIVGHVNKDSNIAGPKTLEHLVDAVLLLEGERHGYLRRLRASKNRFGAIDETGFFDMRDNGMIGVDTPTPLRLEGGEAYGRCICPVVEGTRAILVEVQALVAKAAYGSPRRIATSVPPARISMLLAVLERYADIDLSSHDVYVRISGDITVEESAVDLAVCAAIASSYWSTALPENTVAAGEVGLGGELRPLRQGTSRTKEALRHSFTTFVGPSFDTKADGINYWVQNDLVGALRALGILKPAGATPVKGGVSPKVMAALIRQRERGESDD